MDVINTSFSTGNVSGIEVSVRKEGRRHLRFQKLRWKIYSTSQKEIKRKRGAQPASLR